MTDRDETIRSIKRRGVFETYTSDKPNLTQDEKAFFARSEERDHNPSWSKSPLDRFEDVEVSESGGAYLYKVIRNGVIIDSGTFTLGDATPGSKYDLYVQLHDKRDLPTHYFED